MKTLNSSALEEEDPDALDVPADILDAPEAVLEEADVAEVVPDDGTRSTDGEPKSTGEKPPRSDRPKEEFMAADVGNYDCGLNMAVSHWERS